MIIRNSLVIFAAVCGLLFSGCQSGDVSRRADYTIYPYAARDKAVADRASMIRELNPKLTKEEAHAQASSEYAVQHPEEAAREKEKQRQRTFEEQLAKSYKDGAK